MQGVKLRLRFGHDDTGAVMRALDAADAVRLEETFSESAELEIGVPRTAAAGLRSVLRDSTAGRIRTSQFSCRPDTVDSAARSSGSRGTTRT